MKLCMLKRLALASSLLVALAPLPPSAFGDLGMPSCTRVALVIGNAEYQYLPWRLHTPRDDAVQIGDALEALGFSVSRILDGDHATLLRGLTDFRHAVGAANIAVIFYSGHASTLNARRGEYLIPVDYMPTDGPVGMDAPPQGVPLDLVMWAVQAASQWRLVIMDADHSEPPAISSEMSFVAYGGKPGEDTNDGPTMMADGQASVPTSPYAAVLLRHLRSPDAGSADLGAMFRTVSVGVGKLTGDGTMFVKQIPVVYGALPYEEVVLSPLPWDCQSFVGRWTFPVPADDTAVSGRE